MSNNKAYRKALEEMQTNPEQYAAVFQNGHCVVLAGPGSGKTKTLTTAMARVITEEVIEPRGVSCITYNNECAIELQDRLNKFGVERNERIFIGTVHSFALTQIISPYIRCVPGFINPDFRVATKEQVSASIAAAHAKVFGGADNPMTRWRFAETKRKRDVDRLRPEWRGVNPELADFIEAYEQDLHAQGLIDFDDMPLIAYQMIRDHPWIRDALFAKFPVLFVDEYQDLGHALHELVLLLCFNAKLRLFAVGDVDQSIYGFNGANPALLESLAKNHLVTTIRLRFNYRSGKKIITASLGALGEERAYQGIEGNPDGEITYHATTGGHATQATFIAQNLIPLLQTKGFLADQIAVLYRTAALGSVVANALNEANIAYIRTDGNALIKRNSPLARFVEACAKWVVGGWADASPPYSRLLNDALTIIFGLHPNEIEAHNVSLQLIAFLKSGISAGETTNEWLLRFRDELIKPWRQIARNANQEWDVVYNLILETNKGDGKDISLNAFAGRVEGSGRVSLSTLHSAKGREFDAVIMFGVNQNEFPNSRDLESAHSSRETRRLFYVGVTRPRKALCLVYQKGLHSPWIKELYERTQH